MINENVSNFFNFLSEDKKCLKLNDFDSLEKFINITKLDEKMSSELLGFVIDMLSIYVKSDSGLKKNSGTESKSSFDFDRNSNSRLGSNKSSYKFLYMKNQTMNLKKNLDTFLLYRNSLREKKVKFEISIEDFKGFLKENSNYIDLINRTYNKFTQILNEKEEEKQKQREKAKKQIINLNKTSKLPLTPTNKEKLKSSTNSVLTNKKCYSPLQLNKSSITSNSKLSNITKGCYTTCEIKPDRSFDICKDSKMSVSDKSVVLKNKMTFLKVLRDVSNSRSKSKDRDQNTLDNTAKTSRDLSGRGSKHTSRKGSFININNISSNIHKPSHMFQTVGSGSENKMIYSRKIIEKSHLHHTVKDKKSTKLTKDTSDFKQTKIHNHVFSSEFRSSNNKQATHTGLPKSHDFISSELVSGINPNANAIVKEDSRDQAYEKNLSLNEVNLDIASENNKCNEFEAYVEGNNEEEEGRNKQIHTDPNCIHLNALNCGETAYQEEQKINNQEDRSYENNTEGNRKRKGKGDGCKCGCIIF